MFPQEQRGSEVVWQRLRAAELLPGGQGPALMEAALDLSSSPWKSNSNTSQLELGTRATTSINPLLSCIFYEGSAKTSRFS